MPGLWQKQNADRMANAIQLRGLAADTQNKSLDRRQDAWMYAGDAILGGIQQNQGMKFKAGEAGKEREAERMAAGLLASGKADEANLGRRADAQQNIWQGGENQADRDAAMARQNAADAAALARVREQNPGIVGEKINRVVNEFLGTYADLRAEGILAPDQLEAQIKSHIDGAVSNGILTADQATKAEAQIRAWLESPEVAGGDGTGDGSRLPNLAGAGGRLLEVPAGEDVSGMEVLDTTALLDALEAAGAGGMDGVAMDRIRKQSDSGKLTADTMQSLLKLLTKYGIDPQAASAPQDASPMGTPAAPLTPELIDLIKRPW